MLETLKLKYFQGKQYIPDIQNASMREQFRGFPLLKNGKVDESICPTGALKSNPISIDLGKCTFCGACEEVCSTRALKIYGHKVTVQEALKMKECIPKRREKMRCQGRIASPQWKDWERKEG